MQQTGAACSSGGGPRDGNRADPHQLPSRPTCPTTPPHWPTTWVNPGATQYQMLLRCRRILGLPELEPEQERAGDLRGLGALQMARLEDAAADLSPLDFTHMLLSFNRLLALLLAEITQIMQQGWHRRDTGWDGTMLVQSSPPACLKTLRRVGRASQIARGQQQGPRAGPRNELDEHSGLVLDTASLMQTALGGGDQRGLDHYFNKAVLALQQQFENMAEEIGHVRACLLGHRLHRFRVTAPTPEGHGMDRCARVGALCASYEQRWPPHGADDSDKLWVEEEWDKLKVYLGCRLPVDNQPGRDTSEATASSSSSPHGVILVGDSLESQLEHERLLREENQARADRKRRTLDNPDGTSSLTVEDMLAEEEAIQQDIAASQAMERQQLAEYEQELERQEQAEAEEDEWRWQQHAAAAAQAEDDQALAQAMDLAPKRMRTTLHVQLTGRQGRALGTFSNVVYTKPGETVAVQFSLQHNSSQELGAEPSLEEAGNDAAACAAEREEQLVQVEAADEEVVQLAAEEFPTDTMAEGDRVRASWRALWRSGVLADAQVEARWGLQVLREFMRELAQDRAVSESQHFVEQETAATVMQQDDDNLLEVGAEMVDALPPPGCRPHEHAEGLDSQGSLHQDRHDV